MTVDVGSPTAEKITTIDLLAFGIPAATDQRSISQNLPAIISVVVAFVVAFAALIFVCGTVAYTLPVADGLMTGVAIVVPLAAAGFVVYKFMKARVEWISGVGELVRENEFEPADLTKTVPVINVSLAALLQRVRFLAASDRSRRSVRR